MVFQVAAMILFGLLPLHLLGECYAKMYDLMRRRSTGRGYRFSGDFFLGCDAQQEQYLVVKSAIAPLSISGLSVRPEWMCRSRRVKSTFHMIYALISHSCFGSYLCRIGREIIERCSTGTQPLLPVILVNTLLPSVKRLQRSAGQIKVDFSSSIVISFMLTRKNNQRIIAFFYEDVMSHKNMVKGKRVIHFLYFVYRNSGRMAQLRFNKQ